MEKDLKNVDQLCEYRSRIGYVGQEPVLFNLSCLENVMHGLAEGKRKTLSNFDIQNVADMCNIDFVKPLVKVQNAQSEASMGDLVPDKLEWSDDLLGAKAQKVSGGKSSGWQSCERCLKNLSFCCLTRRQARWTLGLKKKYKQQLIKLQVCHDTRIIMTIAQTVDYSGLRLDISNIRGRVVEQGS